MKTHLVTRYKFPGGDPGNKKLELSIGLEARSLVRGGQGFWRKEFILIRPAALGWTGSRQSRPGVQV